MPLSFRCYTSLFCSISLENCHLHYFSFDVPITREPDIYYFLRSHCIELNFKSTISYRICFKLSIVIYMIINWTYSLLRAKACQQTDVKYHLVSLGATCVQHVRSPSRYWLSRQPHQISSYPSSSRCWVGTGSPCRGSNLRSLRSRQLYQLSYVSIFMEFAM
jgi:hypothetical protein